MQALIDVEEEPDEMETGGSRGMYSIPEGIGVGIGEFPYAYYYFYL